MKMTRITLAAVALVAVASAQGVNYNFDQAADFSKFKTRRQDDGRPASYGSHWPTTTMPIYGDWIDLDRRSGGPLAVAESEKNRAPPGGQPVEEKAHIHGRYSDAIL